MKKNIFLIGASGRLGSYWYKNLKNFNVICHENKKKVFAKKVNFNLSNKEKLNKFCYEKKINIVINCSGFANVEGCEKFVKKAKYINFDIVKNLTDICNKNKIKLVQISTDHLYDGKKAFYSEDSPTKPLNVYSKTKLNAEKYIKKKLENYLIIRTNFFLISKKKNTFTDQVLDKLKRKVSISCWENIFFTPVHISTLVKLANKLIQNNKNGIYNISSDQSISKYQFAIFIARYLKFDTNLIKKTIYSFKKVKRPLNMSLSNKKIKKCFKIKKTTKALDTFAEIKKCLRIKL